MSELKRSFTTYMWQPVPPLWVGLRRVEMPIKYPTDIVAEHLYTRSACSLFDVSTWAASGGWSQAVKFLQQHVLSAT